jgi:hypothetical protein
MKIAVAFIISFLFIGTIDSNDEKIAWSEDHKLTWDLFKGEPKLGNSYVASTNSGISFSFSYRVTNGKMDLDYTIQSDFYPKLSWYIKDKVSDLILSHEQTHFDISELHARKLRKKMTETDFPLDPSEKISEIYNEIENQRRIIQKLFDDETSHSQIKDEELRWESYVLEQLQVYERWK